MPPDELLERLAGVLRHEIGPAVADPFPRTQAFMASVVLEKLARQLALAPTHDRAAAEGRATLAADLTDLLGPSVPAALQAAATAAAASDAALPDLVAAVYAARDELGPDRFDTVLARVRVTLRAGLDRQLEHAS